MQVSWHGERRDTQPEWGSGRFIGMMIQGPHGHALYAAWNTKHEATMVELPDRGPDRGWRVVIDTGKPAPYDVMVADHWCATRLSFKKQRRKGVFTALVGYFSRCLHV